MKKWTKPLILPVIFMLTVMVSVLCSMSVQAAVVRVPGRVENVKIVPVANYPDSVKISWDKPINCDKNTVYQVYVKHEAKKSTYVKIGTYKYNVTSCTYVTVNKIFPGKKVYVKVRAYNRKTKQYGAWSSAKYTITKPTRPGWISVKYNGSRYNNWLFDDYTITWEEPVGYTDIYLYYRYINPRTRAIGKWKLLAISHQIGCNKFIWRPSEPGNYQFVVRAYNKYSKYKTETSPISNEIGFS